MCKTVTLPRTRDPSETDETTKLKVKINKYIIKASKRPRGTLKVPLKVGDRIGWLDRS